MSMAPAHGCRRNGAILRSALARDSRGLSSCLKSDPDFGAPAGLIVGGDRAVVALGEGVDDRQPESGAASGPRRVGAGEPVKGAWQEFGWESGTVVADPDLDAVTIGPPGVDCD